MDASEGAEEAPVAGDVYGVHRFRRRAPLQLPVQVLRCKGDEESSRKCEETNEKKNLTPSLSDLECPFSIKSN